MCNRLMDRDIWDIMGSMVLVEKIVDGCWYKLLKKVINTINSLIYSLLFILFKYKVKNIINFTVDNSQTKSKKWEVNTTPKRSKRWEEKQRESKNNS